MKTTAFLLLCLCFAVLTGSTVMGQSIAVPHVTAVGPDGTLYVAASATDAAGASELWLLAYDADGTREGELLLSEAPDMLPVFMTATADTLFIAGTATGGSSLDYICMAIDPAGLVGIKEIPPPAVFTLEAGYPNPVSDAAAVLEYTLPYAAPVRLEVRSLTGAIVETIVDDIKPAGRHRVTFSPRDLSSGTYYFMLFSPEGVTVRKLAVIR
ncbi:MAG: T9SS type A sorting domain-containing protein [Bacteroidetes bacterium]|nr:T9SS type A sorting domain-containing protein [Bacteroidota bacterium]